jgi:hypothetical protein
MNNSLSNDEVFASFLKTIQINENMMRGKSPSEKLDFLQKIADNLTIRIGLPRIIVREGAFPVNQIGEFDTKTGNAISFDTKRLKNTDIAEFRKLALTFYHELRHAEQFFRALQYWYQERKEKMPIKIRYQGDNKDTVLGGEIIQEAKNKPLPANRKNFGKTMLDAYYLDPSSDIYVRRPEERDAFTFSREGYRILTGDLSGTSSDKWYVRAFENVDYRVVREGENDPKKQTTLGKIIGTPQLIGYVDPSTGNYAQRLDLSKAQPIPISSIPTRKKSDQKEDQISLIQEITAKLREMNQSAAQIYPLNDQATIFTSSLTTTEQQAQFLAKLTGYLLQNENPARFGNWIIQQEGKGAVKIYESVTYTPFATLDQQQISLQRDFSSSESNLLENSRQQIMQEASKQADRFNQPQYG